jgi:hypothetical protein
VSAFVRRHTIHTTTSATTSTANNNNNTEADDATDSDAASNNDDHNNNNNSNSNDLAGIDTSLGALLRRPCERLAAYARAARQLRLRGVGDETVCLAIEQTLVECAPSVGERARLCGAPRVLNRLCALVDAQQAAAMADAVPAADFIISSPRNSIHRRTPPAIPQAAPPLPSPRAMKAAGVSPPIPSTPLPRPSVQRTSSVPVLSNSGNLRAALVRNREEGDEPVHKGGNNDGDDDGEDATTTSVDYDDDEDSQPAAPPPHTAPNVPRIPSKRPEVIVVCC